MGELYLVSTPIGNLEDITVRAIKTIFSVSTIVCEDTRITGQLIHELKNTYASFVDTSLRHTFISYRNTNEVHMVPEIIQKLKNGDNVILMSDSGTPLISDPGYRIIQEALKRGFPIQIIPGVTAFVTALTGSGLPLNIITFVGYLPEKPQKRLEFLRKIRISYASVLSTYALYVAPHKLRKTLEDMRSIFGNIPIVAARELTKLHEEFKRGTLDECLAYFNNPRGEFVILFDLPESSCNQAL